MRFKLSVIDEISAHVQAEREGGEAKTDVSQVSKIQSEDVNGSQG